MAEIVKNTKMLDIREGVTNKFESTVAAIKQNIESIALQSVLHVHENDIHNLNKRSLAIKNSIWYMYTIP